MQEDTITKFKWFWAWQDEKEEAWLAEMAAQGFHLDGFDFPTLYRFQQGEPAEFVYRLDYPGVARKDRESYLQLFKDAGWEHVGDMGGWVYFRRQVQPGDPTEIFTDVESKVQKYYRVMLFLIILMPIWIAARPDFNPENMTLFRNVVLVLHTILMLLWAFAFLRLGLRIKQLRDSVKTK
jgi:hypothetical protein